MIQFPKYICFVLSILPIYFSNLYTNTYNYDKEYAKNIQYVALIPDTNYQETIKNTVLENAYKFLDEGYSYSEIAEVTHPKTFEKKSFRFDCSGFIAAVYWVSDIVVFDKQASLDTSGVRTIYKTLDDYNKIYTGNNPNIGDIVMFDNTTRTPKPLSHCGLVVDLDNNGTVTFIHSTVSKGLVLGYMNLNNPSSYKNKEGHIINSYLKRGGGESALASNCFNSFGTVFATPKN